MKRPNHTMRLCLVLLGILIISLAGSPAPDLEDILANLRQFQYGQDAAALRDLEYMVAAATATPGDTPSREELASRLAGILKMDASLECQQFVCRQLAIIGTAREVPVLARLLTDPRLSDMARYALGPIPDPAVDQALRGALDKTSGNIQIGIINTLGFRRDQEAVAPLGVLLNASDSEVAGAAAAALGRIAGSQAAQLLKNALPKARDKFFRQIADAYMACAEAFLARNQTEPARAIYRELYENDYPSHVRTGALRGCAIAGGSQAPALVLAALRHTENTLKRAALGCIQIVPGSDATRLWAEALPGLPGPDQILLLGALAERGDAAALPAIAAAAQHAEPSARIAAIRALGKLGDASTVDLLIAAASGRGGEEAAAAISSLRTMPGENTDETIVKSLAKVMAPVRAQLIPILADRNARNSVLALLEAAQDPNAQVASEAFQALRKLADPTHLPALLDRLAQVPSPTAREAAEHAVVTVSRKIDNPSRQSDLVLSRLEAESREPVRRSLLRVLGGIGNPTALGPLQKTLREGTGPEQEEAVRAIAAWPTPDVIDLLLGIFQTRSEPVHRTLALRGLVRLIGQDESRAPADKLQLYSKASEQLRDPSEVRLVLSGLANVPNPRSLELVEPYLKGKEVQHEAAAAVLKIAGSIAAAHPESAKQSVRSLLDHATHETIRTQARALLEQMEQHEDYIVAWQATGPFDRAGTSAPDLFDIPFAPEQPEDTSTAWRPVQIKVAPNQPAVLDLLSLFGGTECVAYLRTWIHSERTQNARLELGSDDGVKAWLNGAVIHANNVDRGLVPGQDKAAITLAQGWNRLLLKITQGAGGWAVCARLRDPEGLKLSDVRFDSARKEAPGK